MNTHSYLSSYAAPRPTCDAWCVFEFDIGARNPVMLSGSGVREVTRLQQGVFRIHFTNPERFNGAAYLAFVQEEIGNAPGGYGTVNAHGRNDRSNTELAGITNGSCDLQLWGYNAASTTTPAFLYDSDAGLPKIRVNAAFFNLRSDADIYKPYVRNLIANSSNFTTWSAANTPGQFTTVLQTDQLSPNGTQQVYKITKNSDGGSANISKAFSIPLVAGRTYTASMWVKAASSTATATNFGLFNGSWGNGHVSRIISGPTASAVVNPSQVGNAQNLSINEWTRVQATRYFSPNENMSNVTLLLYPPTTAIGNSGESLFFYGAQVEEGSVATDFIQTGAVAPVNGNQNQLVSYSPGSRGYGRESRQNLFVRSEEFTNSYWTKLRLGISAGGYTAPNGTTTAMKLSETDESSYKLMSSLLRGSTVGVVPHIFSFHAKAAERNYVALVDSSSGSFEKLIVDLTTGTVTQNSNSNYIDVRGCGDGWWRIAAVIRNSSIPSSNSIAFGISPYIGPTASSDSNIYGPIEQGVSGNGILVWGAQLEYGHIWGDYVKTTTAPYGTTFSRVGVTYSSEYGANTSRQATAWGTIVIPPVRSNNSNPAPYLENHYGVDRVIDDRPGGGSNSAFRVYFSEPMHTDGYCVLLSNETETINSSDNPNTASPIPTTDEFTMLMVQNDSTITNQQKTKTSFSVRALKQTPTGDASFGQRASFYQSGKTQRIHFVVFGGRIYYGSE